MAKKQVLVISPPAGEISFKGPYNRRVTEELTLSNPTDSHIAFKVKTTAPKRYCVRPNTGIIEPKKSVTVAIMLQKLNKEEILSEKDKHKLMIQSVITAAESGGVEDIFKQAGSGEVMNSKFRCVFEDNSAVQAKSPEFTAAPSVSGEHSATSETTTLASEMAKEKVLVISPPAGEISFKGPYDRVVTEELTLSNPTDSHIAFKVKTTAPKRYCVRPNTGIIEPKKSVTVAIMLQKLNREEILSEKDKHKLMIQSVITAAESGAVEAIFKQAGSGEVMENKFRCVFEDISAVQVESPELIAAPSVSGEHSATSETTTLASEMAKKQVLVISPPAGEISFKGPYNRVVTKELTLSNPTDSHIAFKVKTTAPKRYCVRPNTGVIGPKKSVTVAIMLQPQNREEILSEMHKHKLMIQSVITAAENGAVEDIFKLAGSSEVMDSKFRCVFEDISAVQAKSPEFTVTPSVSGEHSVNSETTTLASLKEQSTKEVNMLKKNEVLAALVTMSRSGSTHTGPKMKISVLFMVAIAVRKFQEIELSKFKRSLTFDFDRRVALDTLRRLCATTGFLSKKEHFIKLSYYARKFNLTFGNIGFIGVQLNKLCDLLKDDSFDEQTMYFLCLSLKHLCRNSDGEANPLDNCLIAQRIATVGNRPLVKNELVTLLLCRLEKSSSEWLGSDESSKLRSIIVNNTQLNNDVKAQILGKLAGSKASGRFDKQEMNGMNKSVAVRKPKKNLQTVSKTIQTVKSQHESKSSEAVDFEFLNLSNCMKNRNKEMNRIAVIEPLDTIDSKSGSDKSIFNTTWGEIVNLYSVVSRDGMLKTEDKDHYLPAKFLGLHYFHSSAKSGGMNDMLNIRRMYSFFINRTCASIFAKITQKQQLGNDAIDVLMRCVVDFESLVSLLVLKEDYVKRLLDNIFEKYWELKEITNLDTVYNFFKKVSDLTMEEYISKGWIYNTTEVRMKSDYDENELKKIIRAEVNAVRLDAMKALYNCARRDQKGVLTKKRMATITKFAQRNDQGDKEMMSYIFKIMEFAETLDDFDHVEAFDMYLGYLKPDSVNDFNKSIKFLTNQARDRKRCQELFNDNVIGKLIELVGSGDNEEQKLAILEMINISLEHEETKALSEGNLRQLIDHCLKSKTTSLMNAGLTSLLMSTDKSQYLSADILNKLSTAFREISDKEEITSYIVFILSRVFCLDHPELQRAHISDRTFVESVSKKLFCDHIVQLNSDDDKQRTSFHKPTEKNVDHNPSNKISSLSAKIIARSVEHKVTLSSITIENLLSILQHNSQGDKQTMIVAAKCVYDSTKYMSLGSGNLNQLLDSINCPIYDVSVHIQAAYLKECVKVAYSTELLKNIHLENISALYVQESLKLNNVDYEAEINTNLFKTLLYEARKQHFNDKNIFLLFDNILNLNGKYAPQVLRILVSYSRKFLMPETTVRTLENLLSVASYFEEALLALQFFVLNGGLSITIKTLTVFSDYLCSSPSKRVRLYWFKLLDRLSQSQELPDNIFYKFEMVRAAYALDCGIDDRHSVIQFVESVTKKGIHLPVDTKQALERELAHPDVLKTFQNVSKQKQIIDQHLLESLIKLFDPSSKAANTTVNNKILIKIFENAAKNNQSLPKHLLNKLELAFRLTDLEPDVLPLFIYLAQKGEHLSQDVNHKLINILADEQVSVLKQELLSSLGSLIVAQSAEINLYLPKINQILEKEITSDNFNIQKSCVSTIAKMIKITKRLDDNLIKKLFEIGTDLNSNRTIKCEIQNLFDSIDDSHNPLIKERGYREQIKLANLVGTSHRDVLNQIVRYRDTELFVQNYNQLKEIIDSGDETLQEEALNLLINYKFKSKITDELLESIVILFESTLVETLSKSCLNLLELVAKSEKTLTGKAQQIWNDKLNRTDNIQKFLEGSVFQEIKKYILFEKSNVAILNMMELIQDSSKIDGVQNLVDLIELIASEASNDYFNNKLFVLLVELCLNWRISMDVLPYYCRIIKEQKFYNVQECLEKLVECFIENPQEMSHLETQLFECMLNAHKFIHLSDNCMEFVMKNLGNSNPLISGYSFGILRTSKDKYQDEKYTNALKCWCDFMIQSLAKNINVDIEQTNLDVLETIMSVKFLDVSIFAKEPKSLWKQELLISSIFSCFKAYPTDQINFNTHWSTVVDKFKYHKSCKILFLIHNSTFDSFTQILELTTMILELKTVDEVTQILTIHGPEPYEAFKQDWCTRKIVQKFQSQNKQGISCKYSSKLAEKLCSLFNVSFIRKLMDCFKSIDNLSAFEDLLNFCSKEKIHLSDMLNIEDVSLNDVKGLIEANHLCKVSKIIQPEGEVDRQSFIQVYGTLKAAGWKYGQLRQLVTTFNPKGTFGLFQNWLQFLNTIRTFNLSPSKFSKVQQILSNTTSFLEMIRELNKLVIENRFQLEGKVKDLPELLTELKKTNGADIDASSLNIKRLIFEEQKDKLEWTENKIDAWSKEVRTPGKTFTDEEAIAVILRANFLVTGHTLTDTQILSSLIALKPGRNPRGKLFQIATGEGKSTIICILAIIKALRGKRVDVITSSPVLAERDVKQKAKLYQMFDLTCSDNSDKTVYISGEKNCYKANVVYGEMSQFQFDILRDNYSKLGTLCGRKFEMAIVDEVDSMLIDDSSKIARLSSTVPGMDHFQALYVIIWQRLLAIKEKFIMFKDTMYYVYGKIGHENGKICMEMADYDNEFIKIADLEDFLLNNKDSIGHVADIVGDDIDGYLMKTLGDYLDSQIKQNKIFIPNNFQDFLHKQKPKWIANPVEAMNYQENVHYIVQGGEIKPVDYSNTGVVQSSTSWSDGLHQFLQLKHNLKMTSETLTTNFLSNIGFMNKYEELCGVTGTLGSKTARSVLKDVYKVDLIDIPQRREKQFLELDPIVVRGQADWLKAIATNIIQEIDKSRGILVICETIECANRINEMLKNKIIANAVKLYTINESEQEENVERISAGQVIIATNLAGRGMDIQTDDIEPTGGLHVILTFLPNNERVECQAFGRTARQGKRGTGLMILNGASLIGYSETSKDGLNKEREQAESDQLKEFQQNELKLIQLKDKLFDTFCTFLNDEIRLGIRRNARQIKDLSFQINKYFLDLKPTMLEVCTLAAVEEQWAGFLSKLDEGVIPCEKGEAECRALIDQLRSDFRTNELIKNPYYYVSIANDILVNEYYQISDLIDSKASRALEYFNKAIKLEAVMKKQKKSKSSDHELEKSQAQDEDWKDDVFGSGSAHLGVAWCSILSKEGDYKTDALASFKTALNCLSNEMSILNATQLLLEQKQPGYVNSDLYKQLNVKATILGSYLTGISNCIEAIKRSKRMFDLVAVKKHNENENALETIEQFNDQERNEKGSFKNSETKEKLKGDMSYSLIFNNLTVREDSGTIDQALNTLANAFNKSLVKSEEHSSLNDDSYSNIRLNLKSIELSKLSGDLFNPDKVFKDLSRDSAIRTLKSERTYCNAVGLTKSYPTILTIRSNDERKLNKPHESNSMNELIKIIEEQELSDENLRFDIVIKQANENILNRSLQTSGKHSGVEFNLDFNQLSKEMAISRLLAINAASHDVEFVLNKSELTKLILDNDKLSGGMLFVENSKVFQRVKREELLYRISQLKTDESPCWVKFEKLTDTQTKKIVESCHENVQFGLSFVDVDTNFLRSPVDLDDGQVNFSFDELSQNNAKILINVLRGKGIEFTLEFKSLSDSHVRHILKHADLEQEKIEIMKVKNIQELYSKGTIVPELKDFISKGIEYIIEISEKLFVPWRSVCAVAALGLGQIIVGGVLITTGFGSTFGMGLVTEGLADIFTAYRAYSNRQFQWSDYCKQKAISLTLSMISMGVSKLKGAVKGAQTVTTGVAKEGLEQAGTQLLYNKKVVGQVLKKTGGNLKSLTFKFIGTKGAEAVAREGLNAAIQCLSNMSFDLMKPRICESIQSTVRMSFNNGELKGYLRKMLAIDQARGSSQLQSRIEQIVSDTINPRHDFMRQQWNSVALPLIKGILSDSSQYGSAASMAFRIGSLLMGLNDVRTLTDNIFGALVTKLRTVDRDLMTIHLILHGHLNINKDRTQDIVIMLSNQKILDDKKSFGLLYNNEIEPVKAKVAKFSDQWDRLKSESTNREVILKEEFNSEISTVLIEGEDVANCIRFIACYFDKYSQNESEYDSFSIIIKSVSDQITDQLIKIIDNQMLQPLTTLAVSSLVDSVSQRVQNALVDRDQDSPSQQADKKKHEELSKKSPEELSNDEKAFMSSYARFRTFAEQINYNSRDYCAAYLQCEMAYHAKQKDTKSGPVDKNVKQMADQVRKEAPATIGVMMVAAEAIDVNLKVVDDPDYKKTPEDIENNVDVIYVKPGPNGEIGHAQYMNSNGVFVDVKQADPTKPDCFFEVLIEIAKSKGITTTVTELRNDTADRMEANSKNFAKQMTAENRTRQDYPDVANRMTFAAGIKLDENDNPVMEPGDREVVEAEAARKKGWDGYPYKQRFKQAVPESLGVENETTEASQEADQNGSTEASQKSANDLLKSNHHEIPQPVLKKNIDDGLKDPIGFEEAGNKMMAGPLKEVIIETIGLDKPVEQQLPKKEHGKVFYAGMMWPPNIVVKGPADDLRINAPKSRFDEEIVAQQPPDHQTAVKRTNELMNSEIRDGNAAFKSLADVPNAQPVGWEKAKPDRPMKPGKEYRVKPTQQSSTEQSTTQQPSAREPLKQMPSTQQTSTREPFSKRPSTQQPSTPSEPGSSRPSKTPRT